MPRLIDRFDAVLLDMNGTFAFGHDRFAPDGEFVTAYRAAGGMMSEGTVRWLLASCRARMTRRTASARTCRKVEPLPVMLASIAPGLAHRGRELIAFETAFATCERGHIPATHIRALHTLAASHRLGVVANVWAYAETFEALLAEHDVSPLFETCIWSSRLGAAKPALEIYEAALDSLALPPERVLYIGSDPLRDVHAPKTLGLHAVWLAAPNAPYPPDLIAPDARANTLAEALDIADTAPTVPVLWQPHVRPHDRRL